MFFFPYSQFINPTPEEEMSSESESDSSTDTDGRQLNASDTHHQQHNSFNF